MSTVIQGLAVNLTAGVGGFASGMAGAIKPLGAFGGAVASASAKIGGLFAGITGLISAGAITAMVKQSLESIDTLKDQADALGLTTDALSRMNYAASFAGVGSEMMGSSLQKMLANVAEAQKGTGAASDAFRTLGLD